MAVSSDVLTHFTDHIDNLESILKKNFIPGLCKERYDFLQEGTKDIWVPMVCFCDIPLHLIHEHVSDYGRYGLSLSKKWGIEKGLNPIIYIGEGSILSKSMAELLAKMEEGMGKHGIKALWDLFPPFLGICCYSKPYQGIGKNGTRKLFYEENEWRYIPALVFGEDKNGEKFRLVGLDNISENTKNTINNRLKDEPLSFAPEDIMYIFIDNEEERKDIIKMIKEIGQPKYCADQIEILCSKIISYDQLSKDV